MTVPPPSDKHVRRAVRRFRRDQRGATAIEYGLILALIVIALIAALSEFASTTTGMWNRVSDKVQNPNGPA